MRKILSVLRARVDLSHKARVLMNIKGVTLAVKAMESMKLYTAQKRENHALNITAYV